ncbi:MAG: RluA family pseudouridine synthase [Spirochaetaceae bacterium]|nr:RluA family pseudouridine synthase [Spirochaetaceae bacterium]
MENAPEPIYSDTSIVVVQKPSGWLAIPDRYDPNAPVVLNALEKEFGRLFVVHRLDKDTSGLLVYARTAEAHRTLSEQFASRSVEKRYLAIVRGVPEEDEWVCDKPLLADADRFHHTVIDAKKGKPAFSRFVVRERYRDYSLVEVLPETGRTHQIRVHAAATGYPILADPLYGDGKPLLLSHLKRGWKGDVFEEKPLMGRTALHAEWIRFIHPGSGQTEEFSAPLPKDFSATVSQLRKLAHQNPVSS